jgi:hypothetical protein
MRRLFFSFLFLSLFLLSSSHPRTNPLFPFPSHGRPPHGRALPSIRPISIPPLPSICPLSPPPTNAPATPSNNPHLAPRAEPLPFAVARVRELRAVERAVSYYGDGYCEGVGF